MSALKKPVSRFLKKFIAPVLALFLIVLAALPVQAVTTATGYSYTDNTFDTIQSLDRGAYALAGFGCGFKTDGTPPVVSNQVIPAQTEPAGTSPVDGAPFCRDGSVISAANAYWATTDGLSWIVITGDLGARQTPKVAADSGLYGDGIATRYDFNSSGQSPAALTISITNAFTPAANTVDFEANCRQTAGVFSWAICPAINGINKIVGSLGRYILEILETPPLITNTGEGQFMFEAWRQIRTLANIFLVPVLLVSIYGLIASSGNRYTITRMMPRLVVATILIQFSYHIAAIIVDIGNILAAGIASIFNNINSTILSTVGSEASAQAGHISAVGFDGLEKYLTANADQRALGAVFGAGLGVLGIVLFLASILPAWPVIALAAFIGILIAFAALALRQLAIVALVVLSPFAFLLGVLPNTERWLREWFDNLMKLILIYPLIALVFSVSSTLSILALDTNASDFNNIIAASMPIIAMFSIPALFALAGKLFANLSSSVVRLGQRGRSGVMGDLRDPGSFAFQQRLNKLRRRADRTLFYAATPGLGWTARFTKPHRVQRTMYNLGGDSVAGVASSKFPNKLKRIFWGDREFEGMLKIEGMDANALRETDTFRYDATRIRHNRAEMSALAMGEMASYVGGHFDRGMSTLYGIGAQAKRGAMPMPVAEEAFQSVQAVAKFQQRHLGNYEWSDLTDDYVTSPQHLWNLAYGDIGQLPAYLHEVNLDRKKKHIAIGSGTLNEQQGEGTFKSMSLALSDERVLREAETNNKVRSDIEALVIKAEALNSKMRAANIDETVASQLAGDEEVAIAGFYGRSGNEIRAMREFIQSALKAKGKLDIDTSLRA